LLTRFSFSYRVSSYPSGSWSPPPIPQKVAYEYQRETEDDEDCNHNDLNQPKVLDEDHVSQGLEELLGFLPLLLEGCVVVDVMGENTMTEHATRAMNVKSDLQFQHIGEDL
jgi:hypothetical protein